MKKNKLIKLRRELTINNIDGYIIPKNDEFFGEYVSPEKERLKYLTGFSGSAGQSLVLKKQAFLFVDGRYTLQAQKEVRKGFKVTQIHKTIPSDILRKNKQKLRIGFDPRIYSLASLINLYKTENVKLIPIKKNLIDKIECPIGIQSIEGKEPDVIAISIIARLLEYKSSSAIKEKNYIRLVKS